MKPYCSIVIPVFNEKANLDELIDRVLTSCQLLDRPFEVILVDDGSRDGSAQKIVAAAQHFESQVVGVLLNRNYGQHAAVMAGFAEARGDVVVTLDADLQNPPEEIPRLVAAIEEGADVVGTVRMDRQDSLFRRLASRIVNQAAQKATGVYMRDCGCMLRAYCMPIVKAILDIPTQGCINLHGSLLPRYRGRCPINWVLPGAFSYLAQTRCTIWQATVVKQSSSQPGTVMSVSPLVIACGTDAIQVDFGQQDGGVFANGEQLARDLNLAQGMRFGGDPATRLETTRIKRVLILGVNGFYWQCPE